MKKMKFFYPLVALLLTAGLAFTSCNDDDGEDNSLWATENITFTHQGGVQEVTVTTTAKSYSTSNYPSWITIENIESGSFGVRVSALAEGESDRSGTITVSAKGAKSVTVNVKQTALTVEIKTSPGSIVKDFTEKDVQVTVTGVTVFDVNKADEAVNWYSITGINDDGFTVSFSENASSNQRSAYIDISSPEATEIQFRIVQNGYPDFYQSTMGVWTVNGTPGFITAMGFEDEDGNPLTYVGPETFTMELTPEVLVSRDTGEVVYYALLAVGWSGENTLGPCFVWDEDLPGLSFVPLNYGPTTLPEEYTYLWGVVQMDDLETDKLQNNRAGYFMGISIGENQAGGYTFPEDGNTENSKKYWYGLYSSVSKSNGEYFEDILTLNNGAYLDLYNGFSMTKGTRASYAPEANYLRSETTMIPALKNIDTSNLQLGRNALKTRR